MIHAMIDLETLSTKPNATILTIGGVKFDPYTYAEPSQGMYFRVDVDSQTTMGRDVQQETVEWWGKQADDVREEALGDGDRIDLKYLIKQIVGLRQSLLFIFVKMRFLILRITQTTYT